MTFENANSVGNNVEINAWVDGRYTDLKGDTGRYAYYAGPVKVTDSCVDWGGRYGEYRTWKKPC